METRLATALEAKTLAALHAASFGASSWSVEQITESLRLDTTQAWIVYEDTTPQGFMLCQWIGREAEILTLCVTPSAQRKGFGLNLLQSMLTSIGHKETQRVYLEVAVDNHAARALYEKCGFRVIGRRANYYHRDQKRVDAILLALEL